MNIFLSYTRLKDQFNKVSDFRDRLENEVAQRAPGSTIYQDKHNLTDGQHFPEEIERALRRADVFLALVSPAWLASEWCRREFASFTVNATDSARLHRVLPVLWVDTPDMKTDSLDLVARTLATINYSDWRDLRYESWEQAANQRQVGKLAEGAVALPRAPIATASSPTQVATTYRFKYGIRWMNDGTPLCNKCGLPLTYVTWATHLSSQVRSFQCSCSSIPTVLMHKGEPIHATDAMREMAGDEDAGRQTAQ